MPVSVMRKTRAELVQKISKVRCSYGEKNDAHVTSDGTLQVDFTYHQNMNRNILYAKLGELLDFGQVVLEDDKKRIVIFNPDESFSNSKVLLGNEKVVHKLRAAYRTLATWDPHGKSGVADFSRNEKGWFVQCRKKKIDFHPVSQTATREHS